MARKKSTNGSVARAEKLARKVEAAVQSAVRDALIMHKRLGNPVADWQNDRVVWIKPHELEIPDEIPPECSAED